MRKIVKDATLALPRVALRPSVPRAMPVPKPLAAHPESARPAVLSADEAQLRQWRQAAERAGYEAGLKQAQAEAQSHIEAQRARVERVLDEFRQAQAKQMQALAGETEAFAFAVLCRVLGQAAVSPEAVEGTVRAVMQEVGSQDVTLHVHPDDTAQMGLVLPSDAHPGLRIEADPAIRLGGCVAHTAAGRFDASFETQLSLLAQALSDARARRKAKEPA